jgi:hypothetical protein
MLDDPKKPPPFTVEHALERLPASPLAPASARDAGMRWLQEEGVLKASSPERAWATLLGALRDDRRVAQDLAALGLPELFPKRRGSTGRAEAPAPPLAELHAHLRGSVPFMALWVGWLTDERWRASVRRPEYTVEDVPWRQTWADLTQRASEDRWPGGPPTLPADLSQRGVAEATWVQGAARRVSRWSGASDDLLKREVRVLAIANTIYRGLLVLPGRDEPGLTAFTEAFQRSSKAQRRDRAEGAHLRQTVRAVIKRFVSDGVAVLELRPTFERRPAALRARLREILLAYLEHLLEWQKAEPPDRAPLVLGLVLSFVKQEGAQWWDVQLDALLTLLEEEPLYRWFVVGIDAAGRERGAPIGQLSRVVERLRDWHRRHGADSAPAGVTLPIDALCEALKGKTSAEEALDAWLAAARDTLHPGWPRLGVTMHAGEDFADPLTGLRAVDEALTTLDLRPGDRLGHALATALDEPLLKELLDRRVDRGRLGVKREKNNDWLQKARGEHILDLAWASQQLQGEQRELALAELGATLSRAWAGRGELAQLSSVMSPTRPGEVRFPTVLFDRPADSDEHSHEWVLLNDGARARFERLRCLVLSRVIARGVVIETCPTSNKIVMDLKTPPAKTFLSARGGGLRVVIATDDPGLFGVWPKEELERLTADEDQREALRAEGLRHAFTRRR